MLKRFLSYYKPHRKIFALDMGASFLVSVIGIFYPMVTRTMLNDLIPNGNYRMVVWYALMLLGLYLIRMLLNYFIQYQGHIMGVQMQAQMRRDMFMQLQRLPYRFYDDHETGKIMSRMTNDLMNISELAHHGPENMFISLISILTSFAYLSTINLPLTLIIFTCVPLLVLLCSALRLKMKNAFRESRVAIAKINASLESSISGIRVTKAFTNAALEQEKFEQGNAEFVGARNRAYKAMGQFHSTTWFITNVFPVLVLVTGGYFLYRKSINFADYSAFIVSVDLFLTPLTMLISFMEQYQDGVTGFERFLEIVDAEPEEDLPQAKDCGRLKGKIELKNVTYDYGDGRDVLHDVSLTVAQGETFALVGPSGGGKTTICHLLPRFYPLEHGQILIDSTDIRNYTLHSLRQNIGIVQQDVFLFNASIRENILYGRPGASEHDVILAAKRANIHDYICSLEDGYDTEIGERGVRLSGGQKQRLSIARVFLKDPAILILDEATSALDNTTEILVQQALDELCRGRTTIVVAHRLSTVKNADKIAVLDGGKITELGRHEDLMRLDGTYAALYRLQFRQDEDGAAQRCTAER